jgi:cytochrome d ubiquinol oxidase subunit I
MGPAGLVAILAGWITTEMGRQPWVVYGVMRTRDAVSQHDLGTLAVSLGLFVVVYLFVFGAGVAYVLRLVRKGPVPHEGDLTNQSEPGEGQQPMQPIFLGNATPPAGEQP